MMEMETGWVFWITGLAGAGKTTIGEKFFSMLVQNRGNSIFLDGDRVRDIVMPEAGYSLSDRWECTRRYSLLCKLLSAQGLNVVFATVSMFEDRRRWNRLNLPNYLEIYLNTPMEVLVARDKKGLYMGDSGSGTGQVVGRDLPCEFPVNPDITIQNSGMRSPDEIAEWLWREAMSRTGWSGGKL